MTDETYERDQPAKTESFTRQNKRWTIVVPLLTMGVVASVLVLPTLRDPPEASSRRQCKHNLKVIGPGLFNYQEPTATAAAPRAGVER